MTTENQLITVKGRNLPQRAFFQDSTKRLLNIDYNWNHVTNEGTLKRWIVPDKITDEERKAVLQDLNRIGDTFAKPTQEWLGGRIASLLCHYFLASTHESINTLVARDWLESLKDLPQFAVRDACAEWRDNQERKPTPAGIRKIAERIAGIDYIAYKRLLYLSKM